MKIYQVKNCFFFFPFTGSAKDLGAGNKRVHANKTSVSGKRFKQDNYEPVNDPTPNYGDALSDQKSQLLQQLVSQKIPKNRNWSDQAESKNRLINGGSLFKDSCLSRLDDDGGGLDSMQRSALVQEDSGGRIQQQQQQQSNSVLMNLLVSGCDVSAGYVCLTKQNNPRSSKGLASK